MGIRRLLPAAGLLWALAFGLTVRALPQAPAAAPSAAGAAAQADGTPTNGDCLDCHADASTTRENGRPLEVLKADVYARSVHADTACVDCHQDLQKTEFPHAEKLQKADCSTCHDEATERYKASVHVKVRNGRVAAACRDCHGTHDIRASTDPDSRTHHLKVAETCATCHKDPNLVSSGVAPREVTHAFADSIHGQILARSGLVVAPTCSSCHHAHDVRSKHDPASPVAMANVGTTCGTCHQKVAREFLGGVHAAAVKAGNSDAPACQTCHSAHSIGRSERPGWQLSVINRCGTCHADRLSTFRDTFHGQVTRLGSRSVAGCADCHGAHQVLPAKDPRSPIAPANLIKTCGACHDHATANFVKYDPHADKHSRERNPALFYSSKFMSGLLLSVFGFFGLHTVLWFGKEIRVRRNDAAQGRTRGSAS